MNNTTKSAQFTLGPWSLCNWMVGNNTPTGEVTICGPEGDEHICTMDGNEDNQANGNLIAAAPEMYEALKTLHGVLDQRMSDGRTLNQHLGKELFECFYGPAIAARAAIAKAEGV